MAIVPCLASTCHARPDERICHAVDDDQVVLGQPVDHYAQVLVDGTKRDRPLGDLALLVDHEDDLLGLIRQDRGVWDEKCIEFPAEEP